MLHQGPRLVQSIIMGFIIGSLFFNPDQSNYVLKIGLALFACTFISYSNMASVPMVRSG